MKLVKMKDDAFADWVVKSGQGEYVDVAAEHTTVVLPPVQQKEINVGGIPIRVDMPCPPGTPGTVTLEKTGHVLSLAQPAKENFSGYCDRVYLQAEGVHGVAFALMMAGMGESFFERFGGFKHDGSNWPQAADFLHDRQMGRHNYDTDEERARQAGAQAQWDRTSAATGGATTPGNAPKPEPEQPATDVPIEGQGQ